MSMSGSNSIKSVNQLLSVLKKDPDLESKIKSDPINALEEIKSAAVPDTQVYRLVVGSLGLALLGSVAGAIIIALYPGQNTSIPDILIATASASVGALAGILMPYSTSDA